MELETLGTGSIEQSQPMTCILTLYVTAEILPSGEANNGLHLELLLNPTDLSVPGDLLDLRTTTSGFKSTRQRYEILRTRTLADAVSELTVARGRLSRLLLHFPVSHGHAAGGHGVADELFACELIESMTAGNCQCHTLSWREIDVQYLDWAAETSWGISTNLRILSDEGAKHWITCNQLSDVLFPPCEVCETPTAARGICAGCCIAFLMGKHVRLGEASLVRLLTVDVAYMILRAIHTNDTSLVI